MAQIANLIGSINDLRIWAASAKPKEFVTYHIGNLAAHRATNADLNAMAELVRLLQETGWLIQHTRPIRLAAINGSAYVATRTGAGWAPECVLHGRITSRMWRAMKAIRDRVGYQSTHRAIRDELLSSEDEAANILAYLYVRSWVEEAAEKGYRLSDAGAQAML
jgi:hypothetical protein